MYSVLAMYQQRISGLMCQSSSSSKWKLITEWKARLPSNASDKIGAFAIFIAYTIKDTIRSNRRSILLPSIIPWASECCHLLNCNFHMSGSSTSLSPMAFARENGLSRELFTRLRNRWVYDHVNSVNWLDSKKISSFFRSAAFRLSVSSQSYDLLYILTDNINRIP